MYVINDLRKEQRNSINQLTLPENDNEYSEWVRNGSSHTTSIIRWDVVGIRGLRVRILRNGNREES